MTARRYYQHHRPESPALGAFVPDDRTLVFAHEDLLRELIEDRKPLPAPLPGTKPGTRSSKVRSCWHSRRDGFADESPRDCKADPAASGHAPDHGPDARDDLSVAR